MPPRVPKRFPKWVPLLFDYLSQQCTDDGALRFYDAISAQSEAQWEGFSATYAPVDPPAPKRTDPSKSLKSTLKRFNDAVESAPRRNRRKLVEDFSSEMQQLTPALRDVLTEVMVGGDTDASGNNNNNNNNSGSPQSFGSSAAMAAHSDIMDYVQEDDVAGAPSTTVGDGSGATIAAYPQRIRVRRPQRAPLVERTDQLYDAIRAEANEAGIGEDHPLVASVEQLYGLARELIDVSCDDNDNHAL